MDWCKKWRQPIVSDFTMGVKENYNFSSGSHSTIVPTTDETFSLGITYQSYPTFVIGFLDFIFKLFMKMFEFTFIIYEQYLFKELRWGSVQDTVDGSEQSTPAFVVENKNHTGLRQIFRVIPKLTFLFAEIWDRTIESDFV